MASCSEQFLKFHEIVFIGLRGVADQRCPPYVVMAKSLFCSGTPQNHADKNLKQEVQYGLMQ